MTDPVTVALSVFRCYVEAGDSLDRAEELALQAAEAVREQNEAEERAHARRRDDPLRLADMAQVVGRTRAHVAERAGTGHS